MDEEDDVVGWVLLCDCDGKRFFRGKSTWREEGAKHYALKGHPSARYAHHARRYPTQEVAERALASIVAALRQGRDAHTRSLWQERHTPVRLEGGTFYVHPLRRSEVALVELAACE